MNILLCYSKFLFVVCLFVVAICLGFMEGICTMRHTILINYLHVQYTAINHRNCVASKISRICSSGVTGYLHPMNKSSPFLQNFSLTQYSDRVSLVNDPNSDTSLDYAPTALIHGSDKWVNGHNSTVHRQHGRNKILNCCIVLNSYSRSLDVFK